MDSCSRDTCTSYACTTSITTMDPPSLTAAHPGAEFDRRRSSTYASRSRRLLGLRSMPARLARPGGHLAQAKADSIS